MKKRILSCLLGLGLAGVAHAELLQPKLDKVRADIKKVQGYIDQGLESNEIKQELSRLKKQEASIKAEIEQRIAKAKAEKLKREREKLAKNKKMARFTQPKNASNGKYTVYQGLPLSEQYKVVLLDLEKEQERFNGFQTTINRGVASASLRKSLRNSQMRINQIQYMKTKIERKLASEDNEASSNIKFGGLLDFYYLYAPGRNQEGTNLSSRNYDRKNNDFTMNLFEINVEANYGALTVYADLDFGDFADQNSGHAGDPVNHNIGQAYASYQISDSLGITAGKMYTHVGYEVAKAMENWNYSRSFAFSLGGPFWHEGLALNYSHSSGFGAGFYVYDNWDSTAEGNRDKTYGAQLGYSNDRFHFLFNYINGPEGTANHLNKTVYEFNTQFAFTDSLAVALNGVMGTDEKVLTAASGSALVDKEWSAWVLYLNWKATNKLSFTPRYEIFSDDTSGAASSVYASGGSGLFAGMGGITKANEVTAITLTTTYEADENQQFRFEYRTDSADEKLWTDAKGKQEDSQTTFSLSWLVKI